MDGYTFAGPLLRLLDPETAHDLTLWGLRHGLAPVDGSENDPILETRLWGRNFANPIGLAAGFDKDAAVIGPALGLGFGFVEAGSITPRPQSGNPKPRIFRLPRDGAVINRLGFNSLGLATAADHLAAWRQTRPPGIVGVNLGKDRESAEAADDYAEGAKALAPLADYLVINVSSPNTPGLRALQSRDKLEVLIGRVQGALAETMPDGAPPLLLKVAPDLSEADKEDIAEVALERKLDGLIATNTTISRPDDLVGRHRREVGGLSGKPLFAPSTAVLGDFHRLTGGRLALVGVGGVASGADAYAKIRAGAALVQLYTALIYHGPGLIARIKRDLAALLRRDGFASVSEAVGTAHL